MAPADFQTQSDAAWALTRRQHGVVARWQLIELGLTEDAIRHRLARGRLRRVVPGVYAVGRPDLSQRGEWMTAVLGGGPGALLSHRSAAALLGICKPLPGPIEIVIPATRRRKVPGVRVYRRKEPPAPGPGSKLPPHRLAIHEIPVTGVAIVLVDLATCLSRGRLEAAVNEADHRGLIDQETLRHSLDLLVSPCRKPRPSLAAIASTSTGRSWGWWSRPTASGTTGPRSSRRPTSGATTPTPAAA